ncbi:MAG TPA: hypothetical protein VEY30_07860 [Myxococcaceae bacterium]|nr:hypothetical protein [Myxococcaceae bacterium]
MTGPSAQVRGQSTVEYALLTSVVVLGVVFGLAARVLPGDGGRLSLARVLFNAYQVYADSWAFVLHLPIP